MISVRGSRRRVAAIGAVLVFGAVLGAAGCAADPAGGAAKPAPSEKPTTSAPATPAVDPSPTGTAKLPGCEELLPLEDVRRISGDDRMVFLSDSAPYRALVVEHEFRPVAAAAYGSAAESEACAWGVPNTGQVTSLLVARLSDAQRKEVIAELEGAGFERSEQNGNPMFTRHEETGLSGWLRAYLFRGDIWFTEVSSEQTPQFALDAAAGIRD
ncbi:MULTISPECIES: hypothetical protein [unclassified Leucobacter]|uniref:hypothetical protein n=1 Tax=unclassified Leucobacter TaxID=2621730 RepID=UPI0006227690|nr:hypothetical protein [Leucobacter sp. Ag1]KKI19996.1 hypothetical protein XM48_08670 [Leucobacter sp. Ag1]